MEKTVHLESATVILGCQVEFISGLIVFVGRMIAKNA